MPYVRGCLRKPLAQIGIVMILVFAIHQLSYIDFTALFSHCSIKHEVVTICPRDNLTVRDIPQLIPNDAVAPEIPNIVHQIWKTANVSEYSPLESHSSWKAELEPLNYTCKLWTDNDILYLMETQYSWLLPTYKGYKRKIQRADLARLAVVHAYGGIYADLDVHPESLGAISCLQTLNLEAIFASTSNSSPGLSNHFFMGTRGSGFLLWALQEAKHRESSSRRIMLPYLQVFWSTGPMMLTTAAREYAQFRGGSIPTGLGLLAEPYANSVVRHSAGRSWHSLDGQMLNYVGDHASLRVPWVLLVWLLPASVVGWRLTRRYGMLTMFLWAIHLEK